MRALIAAAALVSPFLLTSAIAQPTSTTAPAATKYSTEETDIGTLLDDPGARAIVDKHIPSFSSGDQIDMARSMTLKAIQQFASDTITDQVLAAIDADLAKLPAKQ